MRLIIGTDEAGYGPNLGPLVVTASSWLIPDELIDRQEGARSADNQNMAPDLYQTLDSLFGKLGAGKLGAGNPGKILVGDSKEAFKSGAGLSNLELAVLSIGLGSRHSTSASIEPGGWRKFRDELRSFASKAKVESEETQGIELPWYRGFDPELPIDAQPEQLQVLTRQFVEFTNEKLVECRQQTRTIEPGQFNQLCEKLGNKASLLSQVTLSLVFESVSQFLSMQNVEPISEVYILCDKHGGRNSYAGIIQSFFTDSWVQVVSEGRHLSRYGLTWNDCPIHFDFVAKGEQHLPIAVASMFSKYVREICMNAFNQFWRDQDESIRPTAGYPVDAKRFRKDIESLAANLNLAASDWWRIR